MKLTPLARSLALAGLLSTASLSVFADEAQKDAAPATNRPMMPYISNSPSIIKVILPMPIKDLLPPCLMPS